MEVNIRIIVYTLINFGILYFVLRHFLFEPVNNVISSREDEIKESFKKIQEDKKQTDIFKSESEKKIKESKIEGKKIVEEYKLNAEKIYDEIINEANSESSKIIQRSKKEIEREKEKVEYEIKSKTINLAIALSSKVLEESIDEKKHRELIDDFISKVGN